MKNYIVLNNKKIRLSNEQVEEIKRSFGLGETKLSELAIGDTFKVGKYEFIVLEHSKETTAVILKDLLETSMKFGNTNNFADKNCAVRKRLEDFAGELTNIVGKNNLIEHTVDLTSDDGLKDYGKIKTRVSLLTCDRYRRYVDILDKYNPKKWWWLATPFSTPKHDADNWVKCVSPSGSFYYFNYDYYYFGVRPFCIFDSSIFVSK